MMRKLLKATVLFVLAVPAFAADPHDMKFAFLGCAKEWPPGTPIEPIIASRVEQGRQVFRVEDPAGCGLKVRNPNYVLSGSELRLSYELYADGPVAACYCGFASEFSFVGLPEKGISVTFKSHE